MGVKMVVTKKSIKSVKKVNVKKGGCPCGCGCDSSCNCCMGDSVKYTTIWAAWRAFWRRGFTEWAGTSSRSEYWLSWIGNFIILVLGAILTALVAGLEWWLFGSPAVLTVLMGAALVVYIIASVIPAISMLTRRMHDSGLSAWVWVLYVSSVLSAEYADDFWVYAPGIVSLVVALLPTQVIGNPFHKNNR